MNLQKKLYKKIIKSDWPFLLVVFIAFYILNKYSFSVADDYWYSLYNNINGNHQPISSFKDVLAARSTEYMTHNGRFIVHSLVSVFCGIIGFEFFKILNSLVFLLLCVGIIKLIRKDYGNNSVDKYIILLFLFIFIPYPGQVLLGSAAMCINYLWSSCAIVWFLKLYYHIEQKNRYLPIWWSAICFPIAAVVGSLQESFTIGLSGALFVYHSFHLKRFKGVTMWLVLGLWIGTAITTLAPGNFARLDSVVSDNINKGIYRYLINFSSVISNLILLVFILLNILTAKICKQQYIFFFKKNQIIYYSILFSIILNTIVFSGPRQLTSTILFSLILLIKLLYEYGAEFINRYRTIIKIVTFVVLLVIYVPILAYRVKGSRAYDQLYNSEAIDGHVVNENYNNCIREFRKGFLSSKYTYLPEFERWILMGFSLVKSNGNNPYKVIAILPESKDCIVKKYNKYSCNRIYYDKHKHYYILGHEFKHKVKVLSEPRTILGKIRNSVLGKGDNYLIDITDMLSPIECNGKHYYYFVEPEYKVFDFVIE